MSKLHDLLSQLSAKGYDGKTAPVGTTLADEMLDHVSGGLINDDDGVRCYTRHERWARAICP